MDLTPTFAILESREMPLPWRSRRTFATYVEFSNERGNVFIKPGLLIMMRSRAEQALPAETGGLLAGRVFRDERGAYSVVLGFAEAPRGAGGPGHVRVTPDGTYVLKQRLAETEPACDVVGWFHSHPSPMQYSATDFANQRLWSDPQHVGVLIFAHGGELGLVYQGPDARLLPYVHGPGVAPKLIAQNCTVVKQPPTLPSPLVAQLVPSKERRPNRTTVGICLATLMLVLVVLVLQVLAMRPTNTDRAPMAPSPSSRVIRSTGPHSSPALGGTPRSMSSELLPSGPRVNRQQEAYP